MMDLAEAAMYPFEEWHKHLPEVRLLYAIRGQYLRKEAEADALIEAYRVAKAAAAKH